jgi:hypothetical protein
MIKDVMNKSKAIVLRWSCGSFLKIYRTKIIAEANNKDETTSNGCNNLNEFNKRVMKAKTMIDKIKR